MRPERGGDRSTVARDNRASDAEVDAFIAQVGAEVRAEKAAAAKRTRLIAMTNATPAGDAPRVGLDMQPIE